ncbi:Interphotoreceptor matrix proteoglycan 2 [Dissostichus eleginoides]|uniref:Interphotoreceptor matrix proteoglycan 2 n=1 Tax=Dissostichus eleginoides TaxID=100907 RepID=A0AAD9BM15_DISEL|nr:Interphotoreceptor matrix proteoglycan 2 [Dissostichus eleginoides]
MQLHACLLLFIITTDKTLASLHQHCGGNVRVDKEPAGQINLTLPGLITDTNQSEKTLPPSNCTWTIDVPLEDKVLKSGETALLSLCDGNKASFTWTGAGNSSNAFQLFYYVQENGRNSSEDNTSPHSDLLSWSESGTSFTSTAPIGQDVSSGTEGGRGRIYEGLEQSYGPQSASSPSSQDQGLLRPTSPLQGLTVAGRGDRETLPLPEEEPNNGADTSGAAHLADGKMSARERTHPYFEQALSTDTLFHTSHTPERKLRYELPRTQMALTRSSDTLHGTDKHKYTATSKLSTPTQDHLRSRVPSFTSSPLSNLHEQPGRLEPFQSHVVELSTTTQTPKFYIVPDQPAAIKVESIELLLQILVEDSRSAFTSGLEEDTAAWVDPYLRKVPGFSRLLGVWSSGHAVQSVVEFETSGALQWLGMTGPSSLLELTGLSEALSEGRSFRSSKITNITLGGLQGDVCDWLLQCPAGYKCMIQPGTSNYSCSSVCHFDYCHHHGICTHHPGQLPVCRCLVGVDFWYMGQRCDLRMTRGRLVGACLAILLVMVTMIGILALVAVRRYRAILIQAKVDQTRSSYRRFNHFDELSGRFWLRSWAGSADSLDNPAFTRSNELLHLRALDRPCCYHDDTLSLASTSASHGTRINTIYPHSSQYGWRGSEMSMGDGVLDSGKASDLSVCSWPVEPIQWTPFPLLQQLASHRTPAVRVSRPRSYCEGMELVDLGKSWTA